MSELVRNVKFFKIQQFCNGIVVSACGNIIIVKKTMRNLAFTSSTALTEASTG